MRIRDGFGRLALLALCCTVACTTDFDAIQAAGSDDAGNGRDDAGDGSADESDRDADMPVLDASQEGGMDSGMDGASQQPDVDADTMDADAAMEQAMPTLDCVEGLAVLGTQSSSTKVASEDFALSCRRGSGNDVAYELQVPETGYYLISTTGSTIDTALAVLDDTCDGAELACSDNVGSTLQSEIVRRFEEGDRVVVVASGSGGENGDIALQIDRVECPELDLSDQPLPTTKTTVGGDSEHTGTCGGDGHAERAYRFVPETSGLYRFSVISDAFDPAIYLETGPVCGGSLLGCGYSQKGHWAAEITRYLTAGEPVTAIVDGRDGEGLFTLGIEAVAGSCPSSSADIFATGTITPTSGHLLSTSCDESGGQDFSGYLPLPDISYPLTHSIAFGGGCTFRVYSSLPITVSLLRGASCSADEVECVLSTDRGAGMTPRYQATFDLGHDDNGDYVIVIESPQTQANVDYQITQSCVL